MANGNNAQAPDNRNDMRAFIFKILEEYDSQGKIILVPEGTSRDWDITRKTAPFPSFWTPDMDKYLPPEEDKTDCDMGSRAGKYTRYRYLFNLHPQKDKKTKEWTYIIDFHYDPAIKKAEDFRKKIGKPFYQHGSPPTHFIHVTEKVRYADSDEKFIRKTIDEILAWESKILEHLRPLQPKGPLYAFSSDLSKTNDALKKAVTELDSVLKDINSRGHDPSFYRTLQQELTDGSHSELLRQINKKIQETQENLNKLNSSGFLFASEVHILTAMRWFNLPEQQASQTPN